LDVDGGTEGWAGVESFRAVEGLGEGFDARFGLTSWLFLRDLAPDGFRVSFDRPGEVSLEGCGVLRKDGGFEAGFSLFDVDAVDEPAGDGRGAGWADPSSSAPFAVDAARRSVDMAATLSSSEGVVSAESRPRLLRQLESSVQHAMSKLGIRCRDVIGRIPVTDGRS
jgi:hypothetical protein